jgi:hypothetical protein
LLDYTSTLFTSSGSIKVLGALAGCVGLRFAAVF